MGFAVHPSTLRCLLLLLLLLLLLTYFTYLLAYLLTAIEFSLGGISPYTSTDKTNNMHKRNNTKTQYKQYKTQ